LVADAIDLYPCTSTYTATSGFSKKMMDAGGYKFAPEQELSPLPHLLPKEAKADTQDEHISQLMVHNDNCNTFNDPEVGPLAPKEHPPVKVKSTST